MKEMSIEEKRKAIQEYCNKNACGMVNPEVFKKGYQVETPYVYGMLASHCNGKLAADELLSDFNNERSGKDNEEMAEKILANAIWTLYRDGFIEICTLTDKSVANVYDQLFGGV